MDIEIIKAYAQNSCYAQIEETADHIKISIPNSGISSKKEKFIFWENIVPFMGAERVVIGFAKLVDQKVVNEKKNIIVSSYNIRQFNLIMHNTKIIIKNDLEFLSSALLSKLDEYFNENLDTFEEYGFILDSNDEPIKLGGLSIKELMQRYDLVDYKILMNIELISSAIFFK